MRTSGSPLALARILTLALLVGGCDSLTGGDSDGDDSPLAIGAGFSHTCRLDASGSVSCWGSNVVGQLGDGSLTDAPSAITVTGGHRFTSLAIGLSHSCALDGDGNAFCWGASGGVGDGTTTNRTVPTPVAGGRRFARITAGSGHSCGIDQNGAAFCWGSNSLGQLGNGSAVSASVPVAVAGGRRFTEISAGNLHTCALDAGGSAFCWGNNGQGQLGAIASGPTQYSPVAVAGYPQSGGAVEPPPRLAQIEAGAIQTCGLDADGQAYCWGSRQSIARFDGSRSDAHYAVKVAGTRKFKRIDAGAGGQSCAVETGGAAFCWGGNHRGQVGDGTTSAPPAYVDAPVAVAGGHRFALVSGGSTHTCGLTASGATFCWGSNDNGQLGNGSINSSSVPVAAGTLGNRPPATPTVTAASVTTTSVALRGSAFSDPDGGDGHTASEWQIDGRDGDWRTSLAARSSGITNASLTSQTFTDLRPSGAYRARVRYRDRNGQFSAFSAPVEFTTAAVPGAADPAGTWDLVTYNGASLPALRSGTDFVLKGAWVFRPDGSSSFALYSFDYRSYNPSRAGERQGGGGLYRFVRDTIELGIPPQTLKLLYRGDTLYQQPAVYLRRTGNTTPPTVDQQLRAVVATIPESQLSGLISTHFLVSTPASEYCTTRQTAVEDGLRRQGYTVVRAGSTWSVTRKNGEVLTDTNVCRVAPLAVWLDKLVAEIP